ncbi:MAG: sigma-70 family RNA polymerase sigma factor [Hyphomicrobiaceae bacterium]
MPNQQDASGTPDPGSDIVAIAKSGDRAAFARLYDHFSPRIKGFLMQGGASADLAEDLAQEAMLTVWRKSAQFDPAKAAASTWIFTIARNLRIDRLRREQRVVVYALAMKDEAEPPLQPDQALDVAQREMGVREALQVLPDDQFQVVRLSFIEGRTHMEIAEVLQIPLGTVKSRMRLAMVKLRDALEKIT